VELQLRNEFNKIWTQVQNQPQYWPTTDHTTYIIIFMTCNLVKLQWIQLTDNFW